jgi:hypothetical protein
MRPRPLILLLALPLAACRGPTNDEMSVGTGSPGAFTPPTFLRESGELARSASFATYSVDNPAPEPSVTGLSREHWALTTFAVPNDLTAHNPTFTKNLTYVNDPVRALGEYPDQLSSLQLATDTMDGTRDREAYEALAAPFAAAADIVLFPVRAFVTAPWHITRTGTEPYRRAASPGAALNAPPRPPNMALPPIPDPASAPVPVQPVPPPMSLPEDKGTPVSDPPTPPTTPEPPTKPDPAEPTP